MYTRRTYVAGLVLNFDNIFFDEFGNDFFPRRKFDGTSHLLSQLLDIAIPTRRATFEVYNRVQKVFRKFRYNLYERVL